MTKEDYLGILSLMKTPGFGEMLKTLSPKEAVIISLKLGYVDDKYFTTEQIATFLSLSPEEIRETTKKILLVYKDGLLSFLDTAIEEVSKPKVLEKNRVIKHEF